MVDRERVQVKTFSDAICAGKPSIIRSSEEIGEASMCRNDGASYKDSRITEWSIRGSRDRIRSTVYAGSLALEISKGESRVSPGTVALRY